MICALILDVSCDFLKLVPTVPEVIALTCINPVCKKFAFFFQSCCTACRIVVPQAGIELVLPTVEVWRSNDWSPRAASSAFFSAHSCSCLGVHVPGPVLSSGTIKMNETICSNGRSLDLRWKIPINEQKITSL